MSKRVSSSRNDLVDAQPMTKAEKRAAAKAAKAAAVAAERRRQALVGALAGLAVIAVIVALVFLVTDGNGADDDAGIAGTSPSSATATGSRFPQLPEGVDPALASRPAANAGDGELTKLTVTALIEGQGPQVRAGQRITVNYVGAFYRTGEEFDASWNRSRPYSFQIGAGAVIPGWDQGLVGVRVGSRVQLDIPSELAYGDHPGGGRPAGPLRFIVDVLAAE